MKLRSILTVSNIFTVSKLLNLITYIFLSAYFSLRIHIREKKSQTRHILSTSLKDRWEKMIGYNNLIIREAPYTCSNVLLHNIIHGLATVTVWNTMGTDHRIMLIVETRNYGMSIGTSNSKNSITKTQNLPFHSTNSFYKLSPPIYLPTTQNK